jgi:hypothetical protein
LGSRLPLNGAGRFQNYGQFRVRRKEVINFGKQISGTVAFSFPGIGGLSIFDIILACDCTFDFRVRGGGMRKKISVEGFGFLFVKN